MDSTDTDRGSYSIPGTEAARLRERLLMAVLRQTEGVGATSMSPAQVMTLATMLEDYVLTGVIPAEPVEEEPKP